MVNHGDNIMNKLTKEEILGRLTFAKIQLKHANTKEMDNFNQIIHGKTFGSDAVKKLCECIDQINLSKDRTSFLDEISNIIAYKETQKNKKND